MAYTVDLETHVDERGSLTVIEKVVPFEIRRVYFINNPIGVRGSHSHKKTIQALVAACGTTTVRVKGQSGTIIYTLDNANKCLILAPEDWHEMYGHSDDCVILVLASEHYDINDYVS